MEGLEIMLICTLLLVKGNAQQSFDVEAYLNQKEAEVKQIAAQASKNDLNVCGNIRIHVVALYFGKKVTINTNGCFRSVEDSYCYKLQQERMFFPKLSRLPGGTRQFCMLCSKRNLSTDATFLGGKRRRHFIRRSILVMPCGIANIPEFHPGYLLA